MTESTVTMDAARIVRSQENRALRRVLLGYERTAILTGDVRDRLGVIPDESVQAVYMSPPYWGLRAYGTPPQLWGGDPRCEHNLIPLPTIVKGGGTGEASAKQLTSNGTQVANVWNLVHPAGHRDSDTKPGALQSVATHNRENLGGYLCSLCDAFYGELGAEPTPQRYVANMVLVCQELRRVLRKDGLMFLVIGDSYAGSGQGPSGASGFQNAEGRQGHVGSKSVIGGTRSVVSPAQRAMGLKPKDLALVPARLAIALQEDGWWVRQDNIWTKDNPMPESVMDRFTRAHEYVWMLTKQDKYYWDYYAAQEPGKEWIGKAATFQREGSKRGLALVPNNTATHRPDRVDTLEGRTTRNRRSVMRVKVRGYKHAHFATFPPELIRPLVEITTSERGACTVCGAPWKRIIGRHCIACELVVRRGSKGCASCGVLPMPRFSGDLVDMGWEAGCKCRVNTTRPCLVLDPFVGSGTTVMVANQLGRRGLGIDLNPEYVAMAEGRVASNGAQEIDGDDVIDVIAEAVEPA